MLGHGTGSELRRPLGYAMVGGLIVSQVLTLFTTPVSISTSTRPRSVAAETARWRKARAGGAEPGGDRPALHTTEAGRRAGNRWPRGWRMAGRAKLACCSGAA